MSQDNELRRLEQFVEKLLARFSELRAEKSKLIQELRERELQIEDLRNNLSSKDLERSEISHRVNKLVEQIEEWEIGLEEPSSVAIQSEATENTGEVFEKDTSSVKIIVEEEGRVQQNLFSIGNANR